MSAVASESFNDVFSATYDNYKIIASLESAGTPALLFRLRVSGADNTSSNYRWGAFFINTDGAASISAFNSSGLSTSFRVGATGTNRGIAVADFSNPFASEETAYYSNYFVADGGSSFTQNAAGVTSVTTSYTGFTLFTSASNMTGTISIYGYAKA